MSIDRFNEWFQTVPGAPAYMLARGSFVDSTDAAGQRVAIMRQQPGRRPVLEIQYPQIQLTLMGVRDGRTTPGETVAVEAFAQQVFDHAIATQGTDCLIQLTPLGSMMGPYFTDEDRPIYALNFELIR